MHREKDNHSHGSAAQLTPQAQAVLQRGIGELLEMTAGLQYRPLPSEKFPFPLSCVAYPTVPAPQAVRAEIEAKLAADPVSVLENALALVELYECNQPDIKDHFLEDMPFLGTCFNSKRCNGWIAAMGDGSRAELEAAVNARWQFKFFSGPARPTGIYILLSMLARYAFVYGRVPQRRPARSGALRGGPLPRPDRLPGPHERPGADAVAGGDEDGRAHRRGGGLPLPLGPEHPRGPVGGNRRGGRRLHRTSAG